MLPHFGQLGAAVSWLSAAETISVSGYSAAAISDSSIFSILLHFTQIFTFYRLKTQNLETYQIYKTGMKLDKDIFPPFSSTTHSISVSMLNDNSQNKKVTKSTSQTRPPAAFVGDLIDFVR